MSEKSKTSGVVYINNVPKKDVRPVKMREPKVDPNAAPKTEAENTAQATTSGEEKRKQAFTYSFPTGMQDANGKNIYGNVFIVGQKEAESNERGERVNVLIPANKAKTMFRKPEHAQQFALLHGETLHVLAAGKCLVGIVEHAVADMEEVLVRLTVIERPSNRGIQSCQQFFHAEKMKRRFISAFYFFYCNFWDVMLY